MGRVCAWSPFMPSEKASAGAIDRLVKGGLRIKMDSALRRECLDQLLFWTATDLELKLSAFKDYYNRYRTHAALTGQTPVETLAAKGAHFESYRWQKHCRGLYQTPIAA